MDDQDERENLVSSLSEQERLQRCNEELAIILDKYGCELRGLPQSRAEGFILLIESVPQLTIRRR